MCQRPASWGSCLPEPSPIYLRLMLCVLQESMCLCQCKLTAGARLLQVPGDHKLALLQSPEDARQLLRQLSVLRPAIPHWRQHRPSLMVEAAHVAASQDRVSTIALQYVPLPTVSFWDPLLKSGWTLAPAQELNS